MNQHISNINQTFISGGNLAANTVNKQGSALVAEKNSSLQTLAELQRFEKDILLPVRDFHGENPSTIPLENNTCSKPQLPSPQSIWNGFQDTGKQTAGLISIIGAVLIMQAKSNSNFWSTLWKQSFQSMMKQVSFAPIIAAAITAQYLAQSEATKSQSMQSRAEGLASMITFAIAIGMSMYMEWNDETPVESGKANKDVETEDETKPSNSELERDENIDQKLNNEDETYLNRAKRYVKKGKNGLSRGQKRFNRWLGKGVQTVQMMSYGSEGFVKFFVTSPAQSKQAAYQAQQGRCQALSEESQQYAQFYGQNESRQEGLYQNAGQNIDYSMNILKSAADSITQTITSMFRG